MKPCLKIKYGSKEEAHSAARRLKKNKKLIARVYLCQKCKKWHIGKPDFFHDTDVFYKNIDVQKNGGRQ